MSDELLPFYNRELAFIRRLGAEFAQSHPKIAGRLRLGPDTAEDPHVERLIEAFAYLNARMRFKLEDDLPEITDALLGVLYPHYQAPMPSMAIVQFVLDRGQERTGGRICDPGGRGPGDRADRRRAVPVPHLLPDHALADRGDLGRRGGRPFARRPRLTGHRLRPCFAWG